MAEVIEGRAPRRRTFYPWHEWTDGACRRATAGVDYTCSDLNFQNALHQHARNFKLKVVTAIPSDGVVEFQFSQRNGQET